MDEQTSLFCDVPGLNRSLGSFHPSLVWVVYRSLSVAIGRWLGTKVGLRFALFTAGRRSHILSRALECLSYCQYLREA